MRNNLFGKKGFTLVELLVVTAILGLVIGAVYSLYLTHMRTAYSQDEVVEVQQNLRIAMDAISKELRRAGALVPFGTSPINASSTATTLVINTSEPSGASARINKNRKIPNTFSNFSTTVESAESLEQFAAGDPVRILRPYKGTQFPFDPQIPLANYTTLVVESVSKEKSSIYLNRVDSSPFDANIQIYSADIIAKKLGASQPRVDVITYTMAACPAGSGLSDNCLFRSVNGALGDVVATNLSSIQFNYNTLPGYGTPVIDAVQVTIDGVTRKKVSSTDTQKSRELTSIIKLRNRRDF